MAYANSPRTTCNNCGSTDVVVTQNMFNFVICRRCGRYWKLNCREKFNF